MRAIRTRSSARVQPSARHALTSRSSSRANSSPSLSQVVSWVHTGRPGAVETVSYEFPVGSYPLTNEVLTAWTTGIARSFVPVTLWQSGMVALLALSGWIGLRRLDVPRLPAALAVAALASAPALVAQLNGGKNDLPALAWLICTGALVAASPRQPRLLAPALVAGGLAVGTKTTVLVPTGGGRISVISPNSHPASGATTATQRRRPANFIVHLRNGSSRTPPTTPPVRLAQT
jgi:hypothetical protein